MQIIWWPRLLKRASSPLVAKTLRSAPDKSITWNSRFGRKELTLISCSRFLAERRWHSARRYRARPCHSRCRSARDQRDSGAEEYEKSADPNPFHQRINEDLDDRLV